MNQFGNVLAVGITTIRGGYSAAFFDPVGMIRYCRRWAWVEMFPGVTFVIRSYDNLVAHNLYIM